MPPGRPAGQLPPHLPGSTLGGALSAAYRRLTGRIGRLASALARTIRAAQVPGWEKGKGEMVARMALIAAGISGVLIVGDTAYGASAGGPVGAGGVVHGCYSNAKVHGSHTLVLQDAGTACAKGSTAVTWNEQGPAGPAGAAGPAGPGGAPGAAR